MAATTRTVVAALVGAVLGALVTAAAMSLREEPLGAIRFEPAALPARAPRTSAPPPEPPAPEKPAARPARSARTAMAQLIDEVNVEVPTRGDGTITGHVRTQDGRPVAGALVRGEPKRETGPVPREEPVRSMDAIEKRVREVVAAAKWHEAVRRESVTGVDGSFALTGLVDMEYSVRASASSFVLRPAPGSRTSARPGATVDFIATPMVDVPVAVVAPDGCTRSAIGAIERALADAEPGSAFWQGAQSQ